LKYIVRVATSNDFKYAADIAYEMNLSATKRSTGIANRSAEYIISKMKKGLAVVAINPESDEWVGFICIEPWKHEKYIANTGLIVHPRYREMGVSKDLKFELFELERKKFPQAKIFSLTTSPAVIYANNLLGYKSISFDELLKDSWFINGANTWVNYVELMTNGAHSDYVAMVAEPTLETGKLPSKKTAKSFYFKLKLQKKKSQKQLVPELILNH